jgi:NADH:ubiquinone oxidoreductase subunit
MRQPTSLLTKLNNTQISFFTWCHGKLVGTDQAGNRYFKERRKPAGRRERRWVLFNGEADASKVPPEWYGWLHHTADEPLPVESPFHKPWVQPHQPNLTGTAQAYRPPGHPLAGGQRPRASADYEPWTPA